MMHCATHCHGAKPGYPNRTKAQRNLGVLILVFQFVPMPIYIPLFLHAFGLVLLDSLSSLPPLSAYHNHHPSNLSI